MKRTMTLSLLAVILLGVGPFITGSQTVSAQESLDGTGSIKFTGDYDNVGIRDPENPDKTVDAGESPSSSGKLRIDFVPQFNFTGRNKISDKDMNYSVNAQLFHDATEARGNFIQVSDYRGGAMGWTLRLKQETQFQNTKTPNNQLNGAVLSLDKSWTNSTVDKAYAPVVSGDIIRLENIGETYNLAEAKQGTGAGTWSISFGASSDNPLGRENSLKPKVDPDGKPMLDASFENKQMQENSAITLSIPGTTKKDPVPYTTVITWTLAELP